MTNNNKLALNAFVFILGIIFLLTLGAKELNLFKYVSAEIDTSKEEWNTIKWILGISSLLLLGLYWIILSDREYTFRRLKNLRKLSNTKNFDYRKAINFQNIQNEVIAIDTQSQQLCIVYSPNEIYSFFLEEVEMCQIVINEKVYKELKYSTTTIGGSAESHVQEIGRIGGSISNTEHSVKEIEHTETEHMYLKILTTKIECPILCFNFGIEDRETNINTMETWQRRFDLSSKNKN
ncbi:MAG: hypothetical protein KA215_08290 [Flavobacterium sp.]|nr:hypothetical protein [Flavobacterium sp.]